MKKFIFFSFFILLFIFQNNNLASVGDNKIIVKEIQNKRPEFGELILKIDEEILIKESDSDENYMFRYIWDLAIDSMENIYVLDGERILKYDKNGNFIQ